jgi:hypothetical protein
MRTGDSARLSRRPAYGEFRGSGCVVMGSFSDVHAHAGRLLPTADPGAGDHRQGL